jgi:hypothetical protein
VIAHDGVSSSEPAVHGEIVWRETDCGEEQGDCGDAVACPAQSRRTHQESGEFVCGVSFVQPDRSRLIARIFSPTPSRSNVA